MDFRDTTVEALAGLGPGARRCRPESSPRPPSTASTRSTRRSTPSSRSTPDLALADAARVDDELAAGGDPGPAGRHPDRGEGPRGRHRVRDDPGLAAPPGRRPGRGRLRVREPAAGRRVRRGRQDEHPGARREGADLRTASSGSPATPGTRLAPRAGSSGGSAAALAAGLVPLATGFGRRRLDPHPGVAVRSDRLQAVARPGADRRRQPAGLGRPLDPRADGGAGARHRRSCSTGWSAPTRPTCARSRCRTCRGGRRSTTCTHRCGWRGRPRSATRRSTPRCSRSASRRSTCSRRPGSEIVDTPSVFPVDPIEPWLVLTSASNLRTVQDLQRHRGVGRCSTIRSARPPNGRRSGSPRRRAVRPGRLPRAEPHAGGAVPVGQPAAHADGRGEGPARRHRRRARRAPGPELDPLHVSVQPHPLAGRHRVRRASRPKACPSASR